ncbi:MAG TPA: PH domain-containing protein, partial [Nakamurella sp.]
RTGRAMVPVAAFAIWRWPWWVFAVLVALVLLLSAGWWWRHRYAVSGGYLRIRGGLVQRTSETIPISRITAVDARRSVIQRLFGVWELKIQVPGDGRRSAVVLPCLSSVRLAQLRSALDPAEHQRRLPRAGDGPPAPAPGRTGAVGPTVVEPVLAEPTSPTSAPPASGSAPAVVLARLDTRTLLLTAVTGTSVPLIIAGGFAAWNRAREILPHRTIDWAEHELFQRGAATLMILAVLFVLAVLVSVGVTSLRLAGFTLSRQGDVLRLRRGLLTEHSATVVVDRVQAVRLVEGVWRRAIGYAALEVEVAGVASNDAERLMFPLIRMTQAVDLIRLALPEMEWVAAPLQRAPKRARRRYYTAPLCWGVAIVAATVLLLPGWGPWLGLMPVPLALLVGRARANAAAWHTDDATLTLRWHRVFARHTLIARRRRVQITSVTRSIWQRRVGLAGFHATLSTKRVGSVAQLDLADAEMLQRTTGRRGIATHEADSPLAVRPLLGVHDGAG